MNFKKFFGIIIAAFVFVFTLAACVFHTTEYKPGGDGSGLSEPIHKNSLPNGNGYRIIRDERNRQGRYIANYFDLNTYELTVITDISQIDGPEYFWNVTRPDLIGFQTTFNSSTTNPQLAAHSSEAVVNAFFVPRINSGPTIENIFNNIDSLVNNSVVSGWSNNSHPNASPSNNLRAEIFRSSIFLGRFENMSYTRLLNANNDSVYLNLNRGNMDDAFTFSHVFLRIFDDIEINNPNFFEDFYVYFYAIFSTGFRFSHSNFALHVPMQILANLLGATHVLRANNSHSAFRTVQRQIQGNSGTPGIIFNDEIDNDLLSNGSAVPPLPTDPEVPGTDTDPEVPGDTDNQDNDNNGYEPTNPEYPGDDDYEPEPEVVRLNWGEQFLVWLRRTLFVQN